MDTQKLRSNKMLAEQLNKMMQSGKLVHAFLFSGGSPESRAELGHAFAEDLLEGNITDFIVIQKPEDKQSIVVEQIEELIQKLRFKPYGKRYVVLIEDAQLMRPEAQNKFLKSLEEPSSDTVFILLSERQSGLLPTVVSRCSSYHLEEELPDASEDIKKAADELFRLTLEGAPYYKKRNSIAAVLSSKDDARKNASDLLEMYSERLRKALSQPKLDLSINSSKRMIRALETAQRALRSLKEMQNPAYTLKSLCLVI